MKKSVKKLIVILCAAAVVLGVGLYFLLNPGYYRDLSEVTQVAPNWTKEMVILYEKDQFRNSRYVWEEGEEFNILKFEPISESYGTTYYGHSYYFNKDSGKLNHFAYSTNSDGGGCEHARTLYEKILRTYGCDEDSTYCHLEAYKGMLDGKRYHISVYQSDGMKNYSENSPIDITFWPGW